MEILVLIMLALFLVIIAVAVIIYVSVRRNSVDKKFDKFFDSKYDDDLDDDDDDDYVPLNIVMPSSFKKEEKNENEFVETKGDVKENEIESETKEEDIQIITPVVINETKKEKIEDVINVLINKRNYIFLANNNIVSKNDHIKLMLDGKVYFGTVTKANYQRDISTLKTKPRKLVIAKNNVNKKVNNSNTMEFIPVKKDKA